MWVWLAVVNVCTCCVHASMCMFVCIVSGYMGWVFLCCVACTYLLCVCVCFLPCISCMFDWALIMRAFTLAEIFRWSSGWVQDTAFRLGHFGMDACSTWLDYRNRAERGLHFMVNLLLSGTRSCSFEAGKTDDTLRVIMMSNFCFQSGPDSRCECTSLRPA